MLTYFIIGLLVLFCAYELLPRIVLDFGNKIALKMATVYESFDKKINLERKEISQEISTLDRYLNSMLNSIHIFPKSIKKVRFKKITHWLFRTIFLFTAFIVIVFWDIFWHMILKYFFTFIKTLKIYEKFSIYIKTKANKYFVLFIFILLFVIMEYFGIYTAVLVASGNILLGILFYIAKFAMVFPVKILYKVGHDKLVEIPWFLRRKILLLSVLIWFEQTSSFAKAKEMLSSVKKKLKDIYSKIRAIFSRLKKKYRKEKEYRFIFEFKAYRRLLRMRKSKRNNVK